MHPVRLLFLKKIKSSIRSMKSERDQGMKEEKKKRKIGIIYQ